ncbi:MAG TPA: hypothetical protein VHU13_03055 [Solirubrobacteraceae bacterium]|jgi:serine/threonine-protein kinase RsbW|nr:hypothetical protein [Solirubrobacteraceae bacterium]
MSGPIVGEPEQTRERTVVTRLRVANALLRPVLSRVVSMVLTRADWPLDRMEEALLVCDALCAHAPACAPAELPTFSVQADEDQAELFVSDLGAGGAERLLADCTLPLVGNVLERLADSVGLESDGGEGPRLAVALKSASPS